MKKTIALLFCSLFFASKGPAQSQYFPCSTNVDGTLTITGYTGPGGSVTLPTNVNGITVSGVASFAFFNKFNVTNLTIPGSITNFGVSAFAGLLYATNLNVGYGITAIAEEMFDSCESLTNVVVPSSVTNIGQSAFSGCSKLQNVSIPDSLFSIGDTAFESCGVVNISIPSNVTKIGSAVFAATSLTNFILLNGVIGKYMFWSCSNLTSVFLPNAVTNIPEGAFEECTGLTNIILPQGVGAIGYRAFFDSALTSIIIPDSVTSIASNAFQNCFELTSIVIPPSVTNMGSYAFAASGLTNLSILGNANIGHYAFSRIPQNNLMSVFIAGGVVGDYAFFGCTNLTTLTLGANVLSFGTSAFENDPVSSLILPAGLTNIGDGAFAGCALTNLVMPGTNITIAGYAFLGNPLTSVCLPANVNIAGDQVFMQCQNLTSVVIGAGVPYLTFGMFGGCPNLTTVLCLGNAPVVAGYYPSDGSVFYGDTNATIYYLPGTTGWGPTYGGVDSYPGAPTALWNPAIQTADGNFGVNNNGQFGFNITGTPNIPVAVMACTNLANPVWTLVQSLTLTNGQAYFSDPQSSNSPARYYGLGFP